jgi:hypothetical protein
VNIHYSVVEICDTDRVMNNYLLCWLWKVFLYQNSFTLETIFTYEQRKHLSDYLDITTTKMVLNLLCLCMNDGKYTAHFPFILEVSLYFKTMNVFLIYLTALFRLYRFYSVKWKDDSEWWIGKKTVACFKVHSAFVCGNLEKTQKASFKRASRPLNFSSTKQ